ncbi:hypothetical protein PHMEG_0002377 [Phytophthora megakarya]|uniref:Fibronectin type-III domain-containing protein n=1 Tax=Phytophthora megakarya TaxID=4795 RepID=A0A225WYH9_9STRA|nr:hypothetical protein PHMEG_0002377 [Phytophthora megakarya]
MVTRDIDGKPLPPLTTYRFKALALQADVVCDTLTEDELESDVVNTMTEVATVPAPPTRPALVLVSGCTASITATPPDDLGGTDVTGMIIGVFLSTGDLYQTFEVALHPGEITVRNLLAHTNYSVKAALTTASEDYGFGESLKFSTKNPTLPGKLSLIQVRNIGSSSVLVEWEGPDDTGGGEISDGSWSLSEVVYDDRTSLIRTILISNISANTEYAFSVKAYNFRTLCRPDEDVTPSRELHLTTQDASVPSQPKNIRTVQVTGGTITLAWDSPRSSGGEPLQWYHIKGGVQHSELQVMANVSATAPTVRRLYGFIASTSYQFVIAGENARGYGLYSASLNVTTTQTSAPGPPKSLRQISSFSGGTVVLAWETPEDSGGAKVQQYNIFRNDNPVGVVIAIDGTTTFQDHSNILAETNYEYSVFASNDVVSGSDAATFVARSNVASVPASPSCTVQPGGGFLLVNLLASPDTGGVPLIRFELTILRGTVIVYRYYTSESSFTVNGLYADIQYSILILTVNGIGKSDSNTVTATTTSATVPDKMGIPTLLQTTGGRLRFGVAPPANFGGSDIVDYRFYVNETSSDVVKMSATEYDLVGLTALTFYSVAVSAMNYIGESEQSDPLIVTTYDFTAPGIVWDLSVTFKTYEVIDLGWKLPQDTGGAATALEYEIEFRSSTDNINRVSSFSNVVTLTGLDPSTMYTIQVRATNLAGEGLWSSSLTVTTDPVSPGVINFASSAVNVSEGNGSVSLTLLRSMGGFMPAKCTYSTHDGTALAGTQYAQTSGEIYFERGSNSQQIVIEIINNDAADDPDKYFSVSIQQYDGDFGTIGNISTATVTIVDDGDAGVIAFGQARYLVSESMATLSVTIVRKLKFSGNNTIAVDIVDTSANAVEGVDFKILSKTVVFAAQQRQETISVTIFNDSTYQAQKVFKLKLRVISGRIAIDDSGAITTIEIVDDGDVSPPGLPTAIQVVALSGGTVKLSWLAPEYLGAKNVTALSYIARVVEVQTGSTRDHLVKSFSSIIGRLTARTAYQTSIAANNSYFIGEYTPPVSILMGAPTPPSRPRDVKVLSQTGGMALFSWKAPFNFGGANISNYRVNVSTSIDMNLVGSFISNNNTVSTNNLSPLTSYNATVEAIHTDGLVGEASTPIVFKTTAASIPGKPSSLVITKATGGALLVNITPPLDLGGVPILNYTLLITSAQYPNVFRQVYQGASSSFYATRLTFSTTYKLQFKVTNNVVS